MDKQDAQIGPRLRALWPGPLRRLRPRLLLLVLLALIPAAVFLMIDTALIRAQAWSGAKANHQRLTEATVQAYSQALGSVERLMAVAATDDDVMRAAAGGDPAPCTARLALLSEHTPDSIGFGLWNLDGNLICAPQVFTAPVNAADRLWFKEAVRTQGFAVGEFQLSRPRNLPTLVFGYPVLDPNGRLRAVLSTGWNLAILNQSLQEPALPDGAVVTIFDHQGIVLARNTGFEQWQGHLLPETSAARVAAKGDPAVVVGPGVDGVERLYATASISGPGGTPVWLSLGEPTRALYEEINQAITRDLLGIGAMLAAVLAVLWWASERLVLRQVSTLATAANGMAAGDRGARAPVTGGGSELDRLALAFNSMAQSVQQRESELQRAADRISRLQALTARLGQAMSREDVANLVINQAMPALGALAATLAVLTPAGDEFELIADSGLPAQTLRPWRRFPAATAGPMADAVGQRDLVLLPSRARAKDLYPALEAVTSPELQAWAIVPLMVETGPLGAMSLSFSEDREFDAEDRELMLAFGRQCGQALERVRLYDAEQQARQAAERAARQFARLQTVTAALSVAVTPDDVAQVMLGDTAAMARADACAILLLNEADQRLEVRYTAGFPAGSVLPWIPLDKPFPAVEAARERAPIWVHSYQEFLAKYEASSPIRAATGHEAIAYLPLLVHGRLLGVMSLSYARPQLFTSEEQELMQTLADLCAQALERSRLYAAETAARALADAAARRERLLSTASHLLNSSLDASMLLQELGPLVVPAFADWYLVDLLAANGSVQPVSAHHSDPGQRARASTLRERFPPPPDSPHGYPFVLRTGQPELLAEICETTSPEAASEAEQSALLPQLGLTSALCVPLVVRGQVRGALTLAMAESGRRFAEADLAWAQELAGRLALALDNAQLYREMEQRVSERTTELRRSNEQVRELAARMEATREEERQRLARELHDQLGGALTGLKLDAARMRDKSRATDTGLAERLEAHMATLDETVHLVRRLASELRPSILDDFGLLAAIEWQAQEFERRSGIQAAVVFNRDDLLVGADVATALFRVVQECLTNIARHAGATTVGISIEAQPAGLLLRVQDNGAGFVVAQAEHKRSLGLAGMRERVFAVGGQLQVLSEPGRGTTVLVQVPLPDCPGGDGAGSDGS